MEPFFLSVTTVTFINRVATHVLELSENGSTLYLGDYDYYVEKKAEVEAIQTEEASTSNQKRTESSQ